MATPRAFLKGLFDTAVAAAHPANVLPNHLPVAPPSGRLIILAGGKAAGSMAEVAERHYVAARTGAGRLAGIAVARHGYGRPTQIVEMVEAGHPVPDAAGVAATERALALADAATRDDLVLVLISGGAAVARAAVGIALHTAVARPRGA